MNLSFLNVAAICAISLTLSCTTHKTARLLLPSGTTERTRLSGNLPADDDDDNDGPVARKSPEGDHPDEAADFFRMQRWQQPGDFPADRYMKAKADAHRLPTVALAARPRAAGLSPDAGTFGDWQSLGPGNVGGRIRGIAIDPGNPNTVYSAAASGGIWKTTDGGATWTPLSDFLPVLTIGAMAMDPVDANTLYVGTGESGHNATALRGVGIFKTSNGGQKWDPLPATATSNFYFVNSLAINPTQNTHLFAGTNTGLFSSTDAGVTWKQQVLPPASTSYSCLSLAIRNDQPTDYLFASCGATINGLSTYTIFRNKDVTGAGTWEAVYTNSAMASTAIGIAPSSQDTIYALATSNDPKSPFLSALLGVFRSTQAGDTGSWTTQANASVATSVAANILSYPSCTYPASDHKGQGGYNLAIAVDPKDPNIVFSLGIDVFRSDDGGVTWGWTNMYGTGTQSGSGGHADQHAIAFDPHYDGAANQTVWIGNDGGMFSTNNARAAVATGSQALCSTKPIVVKWIPQNHGFAVTQFYHGAVLPGGASYFGGAQDNGTPIGTDALGPNAWGYLYSGDGGQVAVDPFDPNVLFFEYVNLALYKSVNGGATNTSAINGITEAPGNFLFINNYTQDPSDPLKMYTGATQLWRTLDQADHWTAASAPTARFNNGNDAISAIAVDPNDPNHLLFGTASGGRIYSVANALTSDAKSTFNSTSPRTGYVSQILFDPTTVGRVYVAYRTFRSSPTSDSQIYRSDDAGNTWTALGVNGSGPLPDIPVDTILLDPDDPTRLYAGTDAGLLASFDRGITWTRDSNPFADALVETLVVQHQAGNKFLYAFTHGRGVWKVNLSATPAPACQYSVSNSSFSVNGDQQLGSLQVSTDPACTWAAQPGGSFVNIQSPAGGQGPGTVYFSVAYNNSGGSRNDTFYIQDQPVTVAQSTVLSASHGGSNDTLANARIINKLPYEDLSNNINSTSTGSDPVHSCTNSADTRTQWWTYTAATSGQVIASVTAEAYAFFGNAGTVITAYPLVKGALGDELACGTVPMQVNPPSWKSVAIQFPVTAGITYIIQLSGTTTTTGYEIFDVMALPTISLSPANPTLAAGANQKFSAAVLGTANTAVRWILSPTLGTLDAAGNYTAPVLIDAPTTVTITARSFVNPAATASSTVTIMPPPVTFSAASVVSASSFQGGAVSPGEMITIFGTSLGPAALAYLQVDPTGKFLVSQIGNTQVTFDGITAPLIYSAAGQLAAIVPYEVAGKGSTTVLVKHNGVSSQPVTVPVTDATPALFTVNQAGTGQTASQSDGLPNGAQYPAARGSVIVLYGTGEGQTNPAGRDGLLALTAPYPKPLLPVNVKIDGKIASVQYAGTAPDDVAGIIQVNAEIPLDASTGEVPVEMTIGNHTSRSNVTVNVLAPDSRMGVVAFNNTGTTDCLITVYKPGDFTHPIKVGTVPGGKFFYIIGSQVVGNDWGVQINSAPIRIVQHVANYAGAANPVQWTITGTAENPYPR